MIQVECSVALTGELSTVCLMGNKKRVDSVVAVVVSRFRGANSQLCFFVFFCFLTFAGGNECIVEELLGEWIGSGCSPWKRNIELLAGV